MYISIFSYFINFLSALFVKYYNLQFISNQELNPKSDSNTKPEIFVNSQNSNYYLLSLSAVHSTTNADSPEFEGSRQTFRFLCGFLLNDNL